MDQREVAAVKDHLARIAVAVAVFSFWVFMTGCATPTPSVITVDRPVPVPCVAAEEIPPEPDWVSRKRPPDASPAEIVRAAGADLLLAVEYAFQLRTLLGACTHARTPTE